MKTKTISLIFTVALTALASSPALADTIHHYRFESDPGFLVDSAGNDDLSNINCGSAIQLPATGRAAAFPKGFDLPGPTANASGADCAQSGYFSSTTAAFPDGFTIETFVRLDTINSAFGKILATDALTAQEGRWNFQIRTDGFAGTQPRELIAVFRPVQASLPVASGFVIEPGIDYYLAATFLPSSEVVFYIQDLTAGTPLQVITRPTSVGTLPTTGSFLVAGLPGADLGFFIDGVIDEVRLSDTVLSQSELLISNQNDDVDEDGILNANDNCVFLANTDQRDSNGDGFGNVCDTDLNDDCAINAIDLGEFRLAFFGPGPDADFNGDGVVNVIDLGVLRAAFFGAPGSSGIPNGCDSP